MHYDRYFKIGQKIVLKRTVDHGETSAHMDSLSGFLASCSEELFQIKLPYTVAGDEVLSLTRGMQFDLLGDIYGLGMRLTAIVEEHTPCGEINLRPYGDLEFFFRRRHLRVECRLWLGYHRGGTLRTLRRRWKHWSAERSRGDEASDLPPFSCQELTLGAGGLRLSVPCPVKETELFLFFIALDDGKPLICALAEAAWTERADAQGLQSTGLRFLNLLDVDTQRIELYVRRTLRARQMEAQGG